MALPIDGELSGDDIDKEFPDSIDGGRPMKLSEYRGQRASKDGALYTLPAAPNSIAYSDFRGVSAGYFIDVLIVGSGGGGGTPDGNDNGNCGGGGGGGFAQIVNNLFVIPGVDYAITVGGVDGVIQDGRPGQDGKSSSFTHNNVTYLSLGGGGGGGGSKTNANDRRGRNGGNGGGQGNARVDEPDNRYGLAVNGNTCQAGDTCIGNRGGGAVFVRANSSEAGGGGGTTGVGGRGWFTAGRPEPDSSGDGGAGIGVGFLNGASFNVRSESNRIKAVDGFGGGGGGGSSVTDTATQNPGRNGGGDGTNPISEDSQLNRDGYNRTGGGGGGGSRYAANGFEGINGAGVGGTGVVIVRYRSSTILDNMGDVNSDPNANVIRRNGNPDTTWKYLIFGSNTRHSTSLNLTFRA
jgi:hypothetical protein